MHQTLSKLLHFLVIVYLVGVGSASIAQETPAANEEPTKPAAASHEDLDALLWMQTSAEYPAITRQTFRLARFNLGDALVDPTWTACIEQQQMYAHDPHLLARLPAAVILDVDETVLDNTAYQSRLIRSGHEFDRDSWLDYVREESSRAIPGAREFIQVCRDARVSVLFVTNREYEVEYATRRNLLSSGLLQEDDPDVLFTKFEREDWTSDKQTRRQHLAKRYRIMMIMGDDLNDFVSVGKRASAETRRSTATDHADWWGTKWLMLPNPNYGGWERSLYDWKDKTPRSAKLQRKAKALRD